MKELQQLLARRGYEVGKIDGKLGADTRAGVKPAQLKFGLPADSYPTRELVDRLRGQRPRRAGRGRIGERARPALQHQGGIDDEAAPAIVERALEAAAQGCGDLPGASVPTDTVTAKSRRSLSGSSSRARWRRTAGLSRSTALATSVAATSAVAASRARMVTESAMPSEKDRPRAPDVAMPPIPDAASRRMLPLIAGVAPRESSPATPISIP